MASSRQLQISITSSHFKKDSISQIKFHNLGKTIENFPFRTFVKKNKNNNNNNKKNTIKSWKPMGHGRVKVRVRFHVLILSVFLGGDMIFFGLRFYMLITKTMRFAKGLVRLQPHNLIQCWDGKEAFVSIVGWKIKYGKQASHANYI